ncbi:glycoside hydrolase family 5 protein [Pedobacter sp. Leaf250]|uniref:glycoside hydrolase family 5 protein n=1 Tax=Pedobacter sp. Leaf250 TaxID=2876559 RepID=UPI001E30E6FC|nr:cellulase family glycosylhydrolase [Pedobacter sp. Leaf250]
MKQVIFSVLLIIFCNGLLFSQQNLAYARANNIKLGINVSWLEQTWNASGLYKRKLKQPDFELLSSIGVNTIRLPVAFERFYLSGSVEEKKALLSNIDDIIKQCKRYNFKLILVNHYGTLKNESLPSDVKRLNNLWNSLEERYKDVQSTMLYFELFNEPALEDSKWFPIAANLAKLIHQSSPKRTLIIGASNYNSIYELSRLSPIADKNIIYTFHFYEPFIFTHQGAEWIGKQVSTLGIPFPYQSAKMPQINNQMKGTDGEKNYKNYMNEGKKGALHDKLMIVKNWSVKNQVPIICGEFGVYRKHASDVSVCNYLTAVKHELKSLFIPGIIWDYDDNFSIFNGLPLKKNVLPCLLP